MSQLELIESKPATGQRHIAVVGELDLAVAEELQAALARAEDADIVLLDLRRCEFVDSTGLAVFLRAYEKRRAAGHRFALFGANHQVLRVLEVTGMTANGLVFSSADEALEA